MNQGASSSNGVALAVPAGALADDLFQAADVRELDRIAIEDCGIPGIRLMATAGRAAFDLLMSRWAATQSLLVCCGTGNNGGDGYIVASLAQQRGVIAKVLQVGAAERIVGDAALARNDALDAGVEEITLEQFAEYLVTADVIVDALLGTGLGGPVKDAYAGVITEINQSGKPVLAIDIPSGLSADTGAVLGVAVHAAETISFIGNKCGLFTGAAPGLVGNTHFSDLGVPAEIHARVETRCRRLRLDTLHQLLPQRSPLAHKGDCGHVMVVGGDRGTGGAISMAAQAAARTGAGLVSVATRSDHVSMVVGSAPEIMAHGVECGLDLAELTDRPDVYAIGPGIGQMAWAEQLLQVLDRADGVRILDADALNVLAGNPDFMRCQRKDWILTPHPGEAARLLKTDTAAVQADRYGAATEIQARYGGVTVLKGPGTLICSDGGMYVSGYGCAGMATGGMGDVLTGILAALCAQGLSPVQAACYGVCVHGAAAELAAAEGGERGTLASDLFPHIRGLVNCG